jgi:xanthine dehydrogenase YagT iron-sulfur-binding subunit
MGMPQDCNFPDQGQHEPPNEHDLHLRRCESEADQTTDWSFTRRQFVVGVGAVTASAMMERHALAGAVQSQTMEASAAVEKIPIRMTVNGEGMNLTIDSRTSILDLLREDLKMTGTKKGCDHGQCGACTVLLNGRRINSCLALAVVHQGEHITTIEGIAKGGTLDPVQQAFLEHDGYQCGYCTPGQICSAVALLSEARQGSPSFVTADLTRTGPVDLTAAEVRERMSGNICRCGAYPGIVAAVQQAYKS